MLLLLLLTLSVIDYFVRPPHGLLPLRVAAVSLPTHGASRAVWLGLRSQLEARPRARHARLSALSFTHLHLRSATAIFTCASVTDSPPVSFVADPFLTRDHNSSGSGSGQTWYVWFEMKNLQRMTR